MNSNFPTYNIKEILVPKLQLVIYKWTQLVRFSHTIEIDEVFLCREA